MKKLLLASLLLLGIWPFSVWADTQPAVIYWDSAAGIALRARIPADADYWRLMPHFAMQSTQSYCAVASAITVLNTMPIAKPVDPVYAPYAYFTQSNFFTPEVSKVVSPRTVLAMGITREQMAEALLLQNVRATAIAGDSLDDASLRSLLKRALGDDGRFVLANYLRASLEQIGEGHWSVLAAYDERSDRVLILDVAKYKYTPAWVTISQLRGAIGTIDPTSGKARGLVIVAQ